MENSATANVSLRLSRARLIQNVFLSALLGVGSVWLIWEQSHETRNFSSSDAWPWIGLVGSILFAWGQISLTYVVGRDALDFRQFGLSLWSIPLTSVGTSQQSEYEIVITDLLKKKQRAVLNRREFDNKDVMRFAEKIDEAREALGVDLREPELREISWLEIAGPPIAMFLSLGALLICFIAIRDHLAWPEIVRRASLALAVLAVTLAACGLIIFGYARWRGSKGS